MTRSRRALCLVSLASGIYLATFSAISYDDAYITFRYAQRLAASHGFTYNDGERLLGVTTPLWTVVLAAASYVLPIPIAAGCLGAAAAAGAGLLLAWELEGAGAYLTALLVPLCPVMVSSLGGEMMLLALLAAAACREASRGRDMAAGTLAGLAFLTRPDAALLLPVVGVAALVATRALPWRAALAWIAVAAPWLAFGFFYFGSPLPRTLMVKQIQGAMGWQVGFLHGLARLARTTLAEEPLLWLAPRCALAGLLGIVRLPAARAVLAFTLLQTAFMRALRMPYYHWYAVPLAIAGAALAGAGLSFIARALPPRRIVAATLTLIAIAVGAGLVRDAERARRMQSRAWKRTYAAAGQYLALHAPPGARIAYHEVGFIGYYSGLPVIDLLGLVSPIDPDQLAKGNMALPLLAGQADYAIVKDNDPTFTGTLLERPWFRRCYIAMARIGDLTIYRRTSPLPPPERYGAVQRRADVNSPPVLPGKPLQQSFVCEEDRPFAVELRFAFNTSGPPPADLLLQVLSLGRTLASLPLSGSDLRDGAWSRIELPPIEAVKGQPMRLALRRMQDAAGAPISLWASGSDAYAGGELTWGERREPGDLAFRVLHRGTR